MALLYRFSKLNDRSNTGIFTFIVTRSVTRDLHRDATTKDFYYGYHRWAISFTRANDKILGVYLILRDTSPSTTTYADFSITLLNREHFSRNEQYGEKQSKFTPEHSVHGINKWIPLSDIQTRNFGDETGEFLLELSLSNLMTVYETIICLQNSGNNQQSNNNANNNNNQTTATSTTSTTSSSSSSTTATATAASSAPATVQFKNGKLETSYFHYATFEWNLTIQTQNSGTSGAANMVRGLFKDTQNDSDIFSNTSTGAGAKSNRNYLIFLNRLTGFENSCRVQYRIVLGNDQLRDDSGMIEQISDMNGRSRGYQIDAQTFSQLTSLGMVNLYFEFYSCNPISEAKVSIQRSISPTINCYDRNKQGWSIESDMESENLKLKLYFMDMHSVPRNHLRYVSWYIYLIAQDQHGGASTNAITSGQTENIMVKNSPHYNYYIQDGIDMGVVMETDILVSDIKSSGKKYLENDNLTVHVEWYDSIMLFNHIYHKYDDIARMHCHQMRREIAALTKENYSLERQIFAYQRSISMANNQMNLQNNMSRLSISSPSKPNPPSLQQQSSTNLIGYNNTNTGSNAGSGAGGAGTGSNTPSSYRSTTQLDAINSNYYSPIVDDMNSSAAIAAAAAITGSRSNSYYDLNNPSTGTGSLVILRSEAINYSKERSATPVPSSPMQPSPVSNIAQQQQPLSNFLGSNLDQGIPTTITSRHSFSGPTSPHHHHHQQHIQQQQQYHEQPAYSSNLLQQQQYYQQQLQKQQHHHHHHHQLPQIPTSGVSYSPSTYRLRSPSSNPNIPQMYRDDVDPYGAAQLTSAAAAATNRMVNNVDDDGSIDDAYQTYSGRYKLTV